ncbi:MAG TPA: TA system VapC family ribonuclease toxin [Candidatus Binatia bacterium]|nr:TA system VapC family ribonuclease toxin [Candidatus Binatia bacterium]
MIVFDANLLIYAYDSGATQHPPARAWVENTFSGVELVGLPWQAISAFLRFMTNRRLPGTRLSLQQASEIVDGWLGQSNVRVLVPGDQHWPLLRSLLIEGQASGALVSDAVIAALAIEYGGVLYTADRDFARFPGLRWVNPLG